MKTVKIYIDGIPVLTQEGSSVLEAARQAGIFIPQLCAFFEEKSFPARCRLCWVQVEGEPQPQLSCSLPVLEGMKINTRTPQVDRLLNRAFELILSFHHLDCAHCPANRRCALQQIARTRRLPLRQKKLRQLIPEGQPDQSRPELGFDPRKCVLCARCVYVCNQVVKKGVIDLVGRGLGARVGTFNGRPLADAGCGDCVACAGVCPTGALWRR